MQRVLRRAGITGRNAHAHAFRKGVITALLLAGNDMYTVSRFAHHRSPSTTALAYDKRKAEEILRGMVLPWEWAATSSATHCGHQQCHNASLQLAQDAAESVDGSEGTRTPSCDQEQLKVAAALLQSVEVQRQQGDRIDYLKGLLSKEDAEKYEAWCVTEGFQP